MMLKSFSLFVLCWAMVGCGGSGEGPSATKTAKQPATKEPVALSLKQVAPDNKAFFVATDTNIRISFDADVNASTMEKAFSIEPATDGELTYQSSKNQITFTPSAPLKAGKNYSVSIDTSLASESGGKLVAPVSFSFTTQGQLDPERSTAGEIGIVILDLTTRNGESNSDYNSLAQALSIAGVTFSTAVDIDDIGQPNVLFVTSYLNENTLSDRERDELNAFVQAGGVLIARTVKDESLFPLFGVNGYTTSSQHTSINFDRADDFAVFQYMDSEIEYSLSVGKPGLSQTINSFAYTLASADTLAKYDDGNPAFVRNTVGNGTAYLLGVAFNDLIQRNFYDLDYSAQRGGINELENSTDTFILFLRAILQEHLPSLVWKHTSPGNSKSTLMVTHDIDSQTGAELAEQFAVVEEEAGITATFNITTHYIDDVSDGDYYSMNIDTYRSLLVRGHEVASHSVGHFRDFADDSIIPKGSAGNSAATYYPYNDGETTTGATVFAELEVSKALLETDLNTTVDVFRAGHLAWNRHQAEVLESLGYKYDSSFNGQHSLTSFPFRLPYDKKLSAELSSIYTFPITISDSISGDSFNQNTVDQWLEVFHLNYANASPTVLLIHPNRKSKLEELKAFEQALPENVALPGMREFGDFWAARESVKVRYSLGDNILFIMLDTPAAKLPEGFSLVIDNGHSLHNIVVNDNAEAELLFDADLLSENKLVIFNFRAD
ncbi:Ig-like domain-containing protein [Alteromonas ponticola]|uniref:Polysaccharide deacetylase family protein n=1 Tax=Alteromonas ponticola TaxID=2720613 RepID=A0ABX1R0H9_9ALTE|nr:Ig-like domain-containing protein [Alteromonas ponticola]NMH59969.1 polysaccharide deacetylase family protein [Alteromonas ponticola]